MGDLLLLMREHRMLPDEADRLTQYPDDRPRNDLRRGEPRNDHRQGGRLMVPAAPPTRFQDVLALDPREEVPPGDKEQRQVDRNLRRNVANRRGVIEDQLAPDAVPSELGGRQVGDG